MGEFECPECDRRWEQRVQNDDESDEDNEEVCPDCAYQSAPENIYEAEDCVYEHWNVSEWLMNQLSLQEERTGHFQGLNLWGRGATGQSIYSDCCITAIADREYQAMYEAWKKTEEEHFAKREAFLNSPAGKEWTGRIEDLPFL